MSLPLSVLPADDGTAETRACRVLADSIVEGDAAGRTMDEAEAAAAEWVRAGVPLESVHKQVTDSVMTVVQLDPTPRSGLPETVVETLTAVLARISTAYLSGLCEELSPRQRLMSALLAGEDPTALSRECGIAVAQSYAVLAVALSAPGRHGHSPADSRAAIARELDFRTGCTALSRLSDRGGTILVPSPYEDTALDLLLTHLSGAGGIRLTGATASADVGHIADGVHHAHELLDLALVFGRVGRLHRIADLAVEYQLTRPGPARDRLAAVLTPIEHAPHLMQTLRLHLPGILSRQAIARRLNVHVNTVDYRLKRVAALTGFDPMMPTDQWTLWSAVIARSRAGLLAGVR